MAKKSKTSRASKVHTHPEGKKTAANTAKFIKQGSRTDSQSTNTIGTAMHYGKNGQMKWTTKLGTNGRTDKLSAGSIGTPMHSGSAQKGDTFKSTLKGSGRTDKQSAATIGNIK